MQRPGVAVMGLVAGAGGALHPGALTGGSRVWAQRTPQSWGAWRSGFCWDLPNKQISAWSLHLAIPQDEWRDSGQTKDRTSRCQGVRV